MDHDDDNGCKYFRSTEYLGGSFFFFFEKLRFGKDDLIEVLYYLFF